MIVDSGSSFTGVKAESFGVAPSIGVPAIVYAEGGDMRYLQWAIGSIMARFIVGIYFIRLPI